MPTAQPHYDPDNGFPWGKRWNAQEGETYVKSFLVETDDLETAIDADGIPKRFEPYSATKQNFRCIDLDPSPHGAKSTKVVAKFAASGSASWGGAGAPPPAPEPPKPDTTYCEFRSANEGVTLFAALNVDTGQPLYMPFPIGGGSGMPAYAGRIEIDVWVYYPTGVTPDLPFFRTLHCDKKTNKEDNLELPPTRGTATRYTVRRNQLLYMGFRHLLTPSGQECVVHTLWWAEKHNFFWVDTKADGAVGSPGTSGNINPADVHEVARYAQMDFAGLWNVSTP